jgi:hypothetical protein
MAVFVFFQITAQSKPSPVQRFAQYGHPGYSANEGHPECI